MSKYDWTNVPNEVNWIATDSNGVWCEYTREPKLSRYGWSVSNGDHIKNTITKFKDRLDVDVFNALNNYEVSIND